VGKKFGLTPDAMAERDEDHSRVAVTLPRGLAGDGHQALDFPLR
jgi:hypothetical protein